MQHPTHQTFGRDYECQRSACLRYVSGPNVYALIIEKVVEQGYFLLHFLITYRIRVDDSSEPATRTR
jgi:hypothetical protein